MPLIIDPPWHPTSLKGNYLYWKNSQTGAIRKSYVPDGQIAGIKKDLAKYHKLTSGLGYPWVPVRYEEPYIYYKSSVSGLETKSFVPPEMRKDIAQYLKPSLGEPGKARIIDLQPIGKGKYAYINRGNFTMLREILSPSERAMMPYKFDKFTKRIGVVTKVLDVETLLIDDEVIIKIKRVQAPDFRKNPKEWLEGKQYLESVALNQTVLLEIDLNAPTDNQGTTVAKVNLLGKKVYIPRNKVLNLTLPFTPDYGKSTIFGGDVPLFEMPSYEKKEGYDKSVYNLLVIRGVTPSYEQVEAERIRIEIERKAEASAFVQNLMKSQAALPPSERDRPSDFGGLDWLGFPEFELQAEAINFMQYLKTGKWGSMKYTEKIGAGNIFRRLYEEKLAVGRGRMRQAWGKPGEYLDVSGGFLIELGGNIAGDPLSVVGYGRGLLTRVIRWGASKELPLTHAGELLYINLVKTRGTYEAKWLTIQAARANPAKYIQKEGLRILGTQFEFVSQASVQIITSPLWKAIKYPIVQPVKYGLEGVSSLTKILRERLSKPIDYSTFNYLLRDMQQEIRSEMQARKADIWILNQEARALLGRGYERVVQVLIEDESKRAWYPTLKPIIDAIAERNSNIATIEKAWDLLEATRQNYLLHALTPTAKEAFEQGILKMPPKILSTPEGRNIVEVMGKVINPYNNWRIYGETIEAINSWSMKKQGFPIFIEDAFKLQQMREQMHVTSIAVMNKIKEVADEFGEPIGQKLKDYGISKIPQLSHVQLPKNIIKMLEGDEIIRSKIPELTQPSALARALWASDSVQRLWRFSVTFGNPNWLQTNVQSGLYVAWSFAHIGSISSYKNAWTELMRKSEALSRVFKMATEGGTITDVYDEKILASDLIREAREDGVLGVEGAADISRNYNYRISDSIQDKIMKAASWALKNSEDIIRFPIYYDARVVKGMTREEAKSLVFHTQGNYGKSALSPFEAQVATRLTNFYVWYKFAPTLVARQLITEPRTLTIPYHVMNAWNGDQGDVERQYLTDRQLTRMIFKIPGTDAYTTPAIFSLANSAYKWMYMLKNKESGFYWDELKRDPTRLLRFLKDETTVEWLNRGAGRVTFEGNKATITYVETGDSISVQVNSTKNKLVITDDMTGAFIKEFPFENTDGKFGIYKEVSAGETIERVIGEIGARTLVMPIEIAMGRDFKFGSVIDAPINWAIDQFTGTIGRALLYKDSELNDPTIDWKEKIANQAIGWFIDHLRDNPMTPKQDLEAVTKVIGIKVWEIERGNILGCE